MLGPNMERLNVMIRAHRNGQSCVPCGTQYIRPEVFIVTDVSALH